MKKVIITIILVIGYFFSYSQITITGQSDNTNAGAYQLIEYLVGTGVSFSNARYCGTPKSNGTQTNKGTFTNASSLIGISSGVVLSTGNVLDLPNNNSSNNSYDWGTTSGDPQLNSIATSTVYDPIGLCFDFVPEGNQINFRYVFGSDEYNEYVGSSYNDVFGFFISGPNPQGGNYNNVNIALLPNGQTVAINNVNSSSNSNYFVNNENGTYAIECDGFTKVLTATKAVNPCQTYQMKLIIGDVHDHIYDSWVFLEQNSFVSPSVDHVDISYSIPAAGNNAIEGCNNIILTVQLGTTTPNAHQIPINITGTAIYGTDYTTNPPLGGTAPNFYITVPAGQSSTQITIIPVNDGINEGTETINAQFQVNVCPPYQYIYHSFNILDYTPPSLTVSDTVTICTGNSATINASMTGGNQPYSYLWAPGGYTTSTITVSPTTTTVYSITASDVCGNTRTDRVVVNVTTAAPVQVSITANPSGPICAGTPVTFTAIPVNGGSSPVYQWQVNGQNVGTNSPTYTTNNLQNGDVVQCILTSNSSCATGNPATSNQIVISYGNPPNPTITAGGPTSICQGSSVLLSANPIGSNYTYQWMLNGSNIPNATGQTLSVTTPGNYQVAVTDVCGTGISPPIAITVNPTAPAIITPAGPTTICQGNSVTLNANTGSGLTYQWQLNYTNIPGATSSSYQATQPGTYTVVVSNSCGPTVSSPVYVTVIEPPTASITANGNTTFCQGGYVQLQGTPCTGCTYQWYMNGNPITSGGNYVNYWAYMNGTYHLQVSNQCFSTTSNSISINVVQPAPVSCTITATPSGPICYGTTVIFNANGQNGGTNPSYQWYVNGVATGTNSPVFSSSTLNNGDVVTCVFTSSDTCVTGNPATSNAITMSVTQIQPVSVTISTNPPLPVCDGDMVTFIANVTNGGTNPSYAWFVNGVFVDNGATYSSSTLNNGDIITCQVTSNANCITGNPAISPPLTYSENPNLPVSVTISQSPQNPVCAGTLVTFVATPTNGGGNPSYQWQVNGNNVGSNSPMYQSAFLNNGDQVSCILNSSAACITGNPATSNVIVVNVRPLPTVYAGPDQIACYGSNTPTIINGASISNFNTITWSHNGSGTLTGANTLSPQYLPSVHDTLQGQITLTLVATNECGSASDELILNVYNKPRAFAGYNDTICEKNYVTLSESFASNYTWLHWSSSGTGYFNDTTILHPKYYFSSQDKATGYVNLYLEAGSICGSAYDTVKFFWSENPNIIVSNDTTIEVGTQASLGAWNGTLFYWFPNYMLSCNVCPNPKAAPDTTTTYTVVGLNKWGCKDIDSVKVTVKYVDAIFVPNAFTPNNDGKNDILYVRGKGIRSLIFKVFDRWGNKVFETKNQKEGWDGKYNGKDCDQGVYTWILEVYMKDNSRIFKKGNVTLIR